MKKLLLLFTILFAGVPGISGQAAAQPKVGDAAPDFTLSDTAGTKVKLSDLRGKHNVVLAFYVFAFTGG